MEFVIFAFIILLLAIRFQSTRSTQEKQIIESIDHILLNLKKRPSKSQKAILRQIAESSEATPGEQLLAEILLKMRRQVSGSDAYRLMELRNDLDTPSEEKELADIILSISNRPDDEAQLRLERLIST